MSRLIPHLRRCVEVKDSLQATGGSHHALLSVADRLPFGTVILAQDWQILEASAGARSLFAHRSALHADQGRLGFTRDRDRKAFADRLNEDPGRARLHDIVLVARAGRPTLSLLVVPIKPQKEPWFRPAAAWLVLIFDPELTSGLSESSIRTALRITPAEAALGKQLALGRSLGEAADRLTLSRHTVRAQLKSIYRKLGIDSQSELVCRILTGPAGLIHSRSPTSDPADRPA